MSKRNVVVLKKQHQIDDRSAYVIISPEHAVGYITNGWKKYSISPENARRMNIENAKRTERELTE